MTEVVVTRGSQITLTKEVREKLGIHEGDVVTVNTLGDLALVSKKDSEVWDNVESFLPDDFEDLLKETRESSKDRLEELGVV